MSAMPTPSTAIPFSDLLLNEIDRKGAPVCVGLDPVFEKLPAHVRARHNQPTAAIGEFTRSVLDAVAPSVPAVKFQAACFERHGSAGVGVLELACRHARDLGLIVVLDAKRGDIGISAEHYAASAAHAQAHAITVSGYLGPETLEPFTTAGLGLFVLVRTSNPGSDAVQSLKLDDGRTVAAMMADHVARLGARFMGSRGLSSVGAVVGATKASDGRMLRERMPDQIFLIPGYGAQGGTADDIRALLGPRSPGVLVTASRSIIYAFDAASSEWSADVARASRALAAEIRAVVAR